MFARRDVRLEASLPGGIGVCSEVLGFRACRPLPHLFSKHP
jgi:hypothetical protein